MNWIIISFAVLVSAFQAHITLGQPQTTKNAIDELSLVTRYAALEWDTAPYKPTLKETSTKVELILESKQPYLSYHTYHTYCQGKCAFYRG